MVYLFLFLICVALIAYFIYDYGKYEDYFSFFLKRNKIGPFLESHEFIYFMTCFFGTAIPVAGAFYSFMKLIMFFITSYMLG